LDFGVLAGVAFRSRFFWKKTEGKRRRTMVTAYALIEVPAKRSEAVVQYLHTYPEIKEAAAVYGDIDVVAKIQATSQDDLDRVIMDVIQGNPDVKATRTLVVIGKIHWTK
jgi:DNA-binding Lrp family transcriptional regulator